MKETIEEDDGRRGRPLTEVRDGLIRIRSCTRRNATDGAAVRRREGDEADRSLLAVSSERPEHAAIHRLRYKECISKELILVYEERVACPTGEYHERDPTSS